MRIVVEFTVASRVEIVNLLTRRLADEGDAVRFATLYLEDIEQQLRRHEGPPPDAEQRVREDGSIWWWRYAEGIWTAFQISDTTRRFMGITVRRIQVFSFRSRS